MNELNEQTRKMHSRVPGTKWVHNVSLFPLPSQNNIGDVFSFKIPAYPRSG